ncbi:hypothetical protein MYSTI_06099 [Myxococcus stipitatus DSM 14675]|uniref:Formylmethanofuran dehydrogenase subunit E domain-containing protein n=1 Tax=Myxococcus stipitatus (strain DSM 14675 / JCM 12634 / Mx s8) TaxID=1278073 RepID=L7UIK0_MYXSD|nr:FmdE family protein [Myxococcus stipitatus]AGC47372.1 hypothetical protein MYSTI_06099 [Myxococcus stipitatus DSM 14675]
MSLRARLLVGVVLLVASGCAGAQRVPSAEDAALARVASIHGGAGPWAVAGYRMGAHALRELGLPVGSFDLEVVHHSPAKVQYTCVADGAAAATGASLGKLNLALASTATSAEVFTTFRHRATGKTITLKPTAAFATRYLNVPRKELAAAGREVMTLTDAEVFEAVGPR